MQREVLDGVPYLITKERNVYYYTVTPDPTPVQIGTKSLDGKLTLFSNWKELISTHLKGYRESTVGRSRKRA